MSHITLPKTVVVAHNCSVDRREKINVYIMFAYVRHATWHGIWCMMVFLLRGLLEIICSVVAHLVARRDEAEVPVVTCVKTPRNAAIMNTCGSLRRFAPAWWAVGPYAQTLAQALRPVAAGGYRREPFELPDGARVALDWKERDGMAAATPIVVCLHGLGGDSESNNARVLTQAALRRGYRSVVYNRRGHGGMSLLGDERSLLGDNTVQTHKIVPKHNNMDDMIAVMTHVYATYPDAPVYMIGFSAGANLCINYMATQGAHRVAAACAVSNGYDIYSGTQFLKKTDPVCDGVVAQMFRDMLGDRAGEVQLLADRAGVDINVAAVMRSRSFTSIEERLVVPAYGYAGLREYQDDDASHTRLRDVHAPLLCVANYDDPLVTRLMLRHPIEAARENENVICVTTKHGGHVGWTMGQPLGKENKENEPWHVRLFFEFVAACAQ